MDRYAWYFMVDLNLIGLVLVAREESVNNDMSAAIRSWEVEASDIRTYKDLVQVYLALHVTRRSHAVQPLT